MALPPAHLAYMEFTHMGAAYSCYGCASLLWTGMLTASTVVGEYFGCFPVFELSSKNALIWADRGFSKAPFFTAFVCLVKEFLKLIFHKC